MQKLLRAAFLAILALIGFGAADDSAGSVVAEGSEVAPSNFLLQVAAAMDKTDGEAFLKSAELEMPDMEMALLPILAALPKNSAGKYDPPAVRYALHHHFSRRHGWHLKGLDPVGEAWNSSLPSNVSALQHMPSAVRSCVERRLTDPGFDDYDVAVLGLTFKFIIHVEARHRLEASYALAEADMEESLDEESVIDLLDVYMAAYILRQHPSKISPSRMRVLLGRMTKIYPYWPQTQTWTRNLFASARRQAAWGPNTDVEFSEVARTVELIEEQYGPYQWQECIEFKNMLLPLEFKGTGRVRLGDFYATAINGTWQFSENVAYLRELGALDESDPASPFVIIPNYNNGHSNCVGATPYHDVCCISECEALTEAIEKKFAAPAVAPEDLAALMATLGSSTVSANRKLSPVLVHRLHAIAEGHEGLVPIYGRLFAQWMHHAYPRECSYPHLAGTTSPKNPSEWSIARKAPIKSPEKEMSNFALRKQRISAPLHTVPWVNREELPARMQGGAVGPPVAWAAIQLIVSLVAFLLIVLSLVRTLFRAGRRLRNRETQEKGIAKLDLPAISI